MKTGTIRWKDFVGYWKGIPAEKKQNAASPIAQAFILNNANIPHAIEKNANVLILFLKNSAMNVAKDSLILALITKKKLKDYVQNAEKWHKEKELVIGTGEDLIGLLKIVIAAWDTTAPCQTAPDIPQMKLPLQIVLKEKVKK
jgi:hypothetical protein